MGRENEMFNFMDLWDETNSTLPEQESVFKFLTLKGNKNLNSVTLILRAKENRTGLDNQ
jgi:hypothetical protein